MFSGRNTRLKYMDSIVIDTIAYHDAFKVSANPPGRLTADRSRALCFNTNPYKPYIFWKLNNHDYS